MGSIHIIYILRLCFLEQFWSHSKSNNNVEHIFTCIFSSIYLLWGFPVGSVIKKFPSNTVEAGDVGLIPGSGRTPGGGNGSLLQYSCLENIIDRGPWQSTIYRDAKSWTQLSKEYLLSISSLVKCLLKSLVQFFFNQVIYLFLNFKDYLYILGNSFYQICL